MHDESPHICPGIDFIQKGRAFYVKSKKNKETGRIDT
jgi:hypothetical protein